MLKPPRDAKEAFSRLAPDLEEIVDFIINCPLTARERVRLTNLLGNYFNHLAASGDLTGAPEARSPGPSAR
jgi:hypothetical protein